MICCICNKDFEDGETGIFVESLQEFVCKKCNEKIKNVLIPLLKSLGVYGMLDYQDNLKTVVHYLCINEEMVRKLKEVKGSKYSIVHFNDDTGEDMTIFLMDYENSFASKMADFYELYRDELENIFESNLLVFIKGKYVNPTIRQQIIMSIPEVDDSDITEIIISGGG